MTTIRALPVLLGTALLFGSMAAAQGPSPSGETAPKPQAPANIAIGVVDLAKVLEAYPRAIAERKRLDDIYKQQRATLEGEQKKAKEIQLKLEDLKKGSFERDVREHELRLKIQDIEGMEKVFQNERQRMLEEVYVTLHEDMERAIAKVAKDRGLLLVLKTHADVVDGSRASKARVFDERVVWFASEEVDITSAVVAVLQVPLPDAQKDGAQKPQEAKETTGSKPGN